MNHRPNVRSDIARRLAQGRGRGEGRDYLPWLTVQEVRSTGTSHRFEATFGRTHHLFSDLEKSIFLVSQWRDAVVDIREQYPLLDPSAGDIEESLSIAAQLGVRHPVVPGTSEPMVMTTDLVLTTRARIGVSYEAVSVKYASELQDPRVVEKLEIERRWWLRNNVRWAIATEHQAPKPLVENLNWIMPRWDLGQIDMPSDRVPAMARDLLAAISSKPDMPLNQICLAADDDLGASPGTNLSVARHALARKWWRVPMSARIDPNRPLTGIRTSTQAETGALERRVA